VVGCARTDDIHRSTGGIVSVDIPSDDGITTRIEIFNITLVVSAIRRAEQSGLSGDNGSIRTWDNVNMV